MQFVNAGRGCKRRPYGRGILKSRSHDCFIGRHECLILFTPSCRCECFYHLQWPVCLYGDVGNLVCCMWILGLRLGPEPLGALPWRSAVLFIFRSRLLLYSAWSGVNRVQVVLSGFSVSLFCFCSGKTLCRHGCVYFFAAVAIVCVDVMVMSSAMPWPELELLVLVYLQCICWIVLVKGRHLVERQFWIDVVRMCDFYMLCRLCVPWCNLRWT